MVAGEQQVAQCAPGFRGCRSPIEVARLQFLPLHLQVELQLVVELAFMAIALEQISQTPEQPGSLRGLPCRLEHAVDGETMSAFYYSHR